MPYRFLEDIATGDAAFETEGRTLEELFREAAVATFEVMVDTKGVEPRITREVELKNEAVDGLLFDWLSELVYLKVNQVPLQVYSLCDSYLTVEL